MLCAQADAIYQADATYQAAATYAREPCADVRNWHWLPQQNTGYAYGPVHHLYGIT